MASVIAWRVYPGQIHLGNRTCVPSFLLSLQSRFSRLPFLGQQGCVPCGRRCDFSCRRKLPWRLPLEGGAGLYCSQRFLLALRVSSVRSDCTVEGPFWQARSPTTLDRMVDCSRKGAEQPPMAKGISSRLPFAICPSAVAVVWHRVSCPRHRAWDARELERVLLGLHVQTLNKCARPVAPLRHLIR